MTDIQLDRSSKRIVLMSLKDYFFKEESKECIALRDRLWVREGDRLNEYMTFAGLTMSQHTSGSCGKPWMWNVEHFLGGPQNFSEAFRQYSVPVVSKVDVLHILFIRVKFKC